VRGHRVELAEIEAALGEHPAVDACAVALRDDLPGDWRLVAYVVSPAPAPSDALREHLQRRLPDYMIPSAWVPLAALPRSPNGKLDRGALPAPSAIDGGQRSTPRDPLEAQLLALWNDVLGARDVGVGDDFFARGGNSLLAVRLAARLHAATGVALPLRDFFTAPTVEAVAARLRAERAAPDPGLVVPLRAAAAPGPAPLFCVHALGGTIGCYSELARRLALPLHAIQAQGLDGAPLLETIPALARCYVGAIRGVQPRGPYRIAGWSLGGAIAYEMACQLTAAGEAVELLALIDSHAPPLPPPESLDDEPARLAALARELSPATPRVELERLYQIVLRNGRALAAYTPARYGGAVHLFRARDRGRRLDPELGWRSLAAQVIATDIPGDHDTMLRGDGAAALALQLERLAGPPVPAAR
jgi:thioesterase domain-containing protein